MPSDTRQFRRLMQAGMGPGQVFGPAQGNGVPNMGVQPMSPQWPQMGLQHPPMAPPGIQRFWSRMKGKEGSPYDL